VLLEQAEGEVNYQENAFTLTNNCQERQRKVQFKPFFTVLSKMGDPIKIT